jgi:hypothetical protein
MTIVRLCGDKGDCIVSVAKKDLKLIGAENHCYFIVDLLSSNPYANLSGDPELMDAYLEWVGEGSHVQVVLNMVCERYRKRNAATCLLIRNSMYTKVSAVFYKDKYDEAEREFIALIETTSEMHDINQREWRFSEYSNCLNATHVMLPGWTLSLNFVGA